MTRSLALKGQSTLSLQDSLDTMLFVEAENIWELAGHLALKSKKSLKAEMRHQQAHENFELKGTLLKFLSFSKYTKVLKDTSQNQYKFLLNFSID